MTTARIWLSCACVLLGAIGVSAQDEGLRGLFLSTRPSGRQKPQNQQSTPPRIVLGHTIFVRGTSGEPVRVGPDHLFAEGDAVRLLVESNRDGYLYIFDREGEGPLRMIFPDLGIRRGDARISAHVPVMLPAPMAQAGAQDWFMVSGPPKSERLFVVFALKPVSGWPRGEELLSFLGGMEMTWEEFRRSAKLETQKNVVYLNRDDGRALSGSEQTSVMRGLTLSRKDPPPSVLQGDGDPKSLLLMSEIGLRRR